MLRVDVTEVAEVAVCHVAGDLDGITVSRFRQALVTSFGRLGLVINLSQVVFIDQAGLTALVGGIRRAREISSHVAIACSRPRLRSVLERVGLSLIVSVYDRAEDALAEVRSAPPVRPAVDTGFARTELANEAPVRHSADQDTIRSAPPSPL